jgi:hypothetical protein
MRDPNRRRAIWLGGLLAAIAIHGPAQGAAQTPIPAATRAPAVASTPIPLKTREGATISTPRPARTCAPGTERVGPEDPSCSTFGDCCRPIGAKKP